MLDALWQLISDTGVDVADMLIFLPSRRAVRSVEKMIAEKSGGVAILPTLVALGEGADVDADDDNVGEISQTERVVVLSRLLAADANVGSLSAALPIAHDLIRMQDYLENEGVEASKINWMDLVDEKYAGHFQNKAKILNILSQFMDVYAGGRLTGTAVRNRDIRAWIDLLDNYKLVVVCGSTASVPATADLMRAVAQSKNGRIILSGKISGRVQDFALDTNPYNAEYKFLSSLNLSVDSVQPIDVGKSAIDFMNYAFGNNCETPSEQYDLSNCHLLNCKNEAVEAAAVARIAQKSVLENKSVLIITPDAAGNQRIANACAALGLVADFSSAVSGAMTRTGRAILNMMDVWAENKFGQFDKIYTQCKNNLFDTIAKIVDQKLIDFTPSFVVDDNESIAVWAAIKELSDELGKAGVVLSLTDARAFVADALASVSSRMPLNDDAKIVVLGTIESRMQTADVVILTGLNDGMFPSRGYENAWLPQRIAGQIGLPSADRKVSLQSLDFMNLSCGDEVYWTRAEMSGGVQTAESRFISRVVARRAVVDMAAGEKILADIANADNLPYTPLDDDAPTPPADWSDVYVTALEYLIHNPYAFYVKHILQLKKLDDYWVGPDARAFGNLVHDVIEKTNDYRPDVLVAKMDAAALEVLGRDSMLFHFWHKRFIEIAPVIANEITKIENAFHEIGGAVKIAGRTVRARADLVWDGGVLDIKTGAAPSKSQLEQGNMPQLPLEALMLKSGGFRIKTTDASQTPVMKFLQLKNNAAQMILFNEADTEKMINAAVARTTELFNMYSAGAAPYEYRETNDQKYHQYDDFARK